ncbi:MAG TPA: TetR/AcrR family transcriptional regulator [Kribbellaceae bacterium]
MALTRDDWTAAALDALATSGLPGVAVEPLARALKATKGSFYWHFSGRDELVTATLERWEAETTTATIAEVSAIADPVQRIRRLCDIAFGGAVEYGIDAALLAAASDPLVAPILERTTRTRIDYITTLCRELGLSRATAARQARITYAMFLGLSQLRAGGLAGPTTPRDAKALADLAVSNVLLMAGQAATR